MYNQYIILLIFAIIFIVLCKNEAQENWEVYKQLPYGFIKTGSEPMNYYIRRRFRKPYRFPFQIIKLNPIKHLSYLNWN